MSTHSMVALIMLTTSLPRHGAADPELEHDHVRLLPGDGGQRALPSPTARDRDLAALQDAPRRRRAWPRRRRPAAPSCAGASGRRARACPRSRRRPATDEDGRSPTRPRPRSSSRISSCIRRTARTSARMASRSDAVAGVFAPGAVKGEAMTAATAPPSPRPRGVVPDAARRRSRATWSGRAPAGFAETRRGPSGPSSGGRVIAPACTDAGTACAVWAAVRRSRAPQPGHTMNPAGSGLDLDPRLAARTLHESLTG